MHIYEIRKLSNLFYNQYPFSRYPEILKKQLRSYDVVLFEVEILEDCFVCVPFRTEMNHNNGYKFRFSNRSKKHKSGLDFSKLVIVKNNFYLGNISTVDSDEFIEFQKNEDIIHKKIEKYVLDYYNHIKGINILHSKDFLRKYRYSTLAYFHDELGL